jgi:hypothetical protein
VTTQIETRQSRPRPVSPTVPARCTLEQKMDSQRTIVLVIALTETRRRPLQHLVDSVLCPALHRRV